MTKFYAVLFLLLIFAFFRLIGHQERERSIKAVSGILRNEYISSNTYAVSKTLSDLELLNLLSCVKLSEASVSAQTYYDTQASGRCMGGPVQLLTANHVRIEAINGVPYDLTFRLPPTWSLYFAEMLSYLVFAFGFMSYARHVETQRRKDALRIQAIELENEMALDLKNRVRHDVASPLMALRSIVKAVEGIDPEIKDFLARAVERTEDIFKQLQDKPIEVSPVPLRPALVEILREKAMTWESECETEFEYSADPELLVLAHPVELRAMLSNLLNNAFEALDHRRDGKISVLVDMSGDRSRVTLVDNGIGMSDETLSRVGTKGFSFGKQQHSSAGSGLGVYGATQLARRFGGSLSISSRLGHGTRVELSLRAAKKS